MGSVTEKIIDTKSVSLDTMQVTIRALHVNKKQMTQAVFKQLPTEYFWSDDSFNGISDGVNLWGRVIYNNMEFVVFSRDGTLYKSLSKKNFFNQYNSDDKYIEYYRERKSFKEDIHALEECFLNIKSMIKHESCNWKQVSYARQIMSNIFHDNDWMGGEDKYDRKTFSSAADVLAMNIKELKTGWQRFHVVKRLPQLFIAV